MGLSMATSGLLLLLSTLSVFASDANNPQTLIPAKPNQYGDVSFNYNIPKPNLGKDLTQSVPRPGVDTLPKPELGVDKPKQSVPGNPKTLDIEELLPTCIEGLVLCKSGQKFTPIKGAKVRITCYGADENGYETTQSMLSPATDDKGYFFAPLIQPAPSAAAANNFISKLTECKTFINGSPSETCKVPTDIGGGMSGAPLDTYRILKHKHVKLYRIPPFVFTPEPQPNGY